MLLNAQAEALAARIILDELRAGRIEVALELLEQRLDTSVLLVDKFADKAEPIQKTNAVESLRIVQQYRLRHPRKLEAAIGIKEGEDSLLRHQTQDKVKKILDKISDA